MSRRSYQPVWSYHPAWTSSRERIMSGRIRKKTYKPDTYVGSKEQGTTRRRPLDHCNNDRGFNFDGLPRELKDQIYSHIVGANADFDTTEYHSEITLSQHRWYGLKNTQKKGHFPSIPGLLTVSRRMHEEALSTIYRENSFTVIVDPSYYVFNNRNYEARLNQSESAVPYGWDLHRIQHLQLWIDMAEERIMSGARIDFDFSGLAEMGSLKSLRLVVIIFRTEGRRISCHKSGPCIWGSIIEELDKGRDEVRETLRRVAEKLPAGVEKISFGLEKSGNLPKKYNEYAMSLEGGLTERIFEEARGS